MDALKKTAAATASSLLAIAGVGGAFSAEAPQALVDDEVCSSAIVQTAGMKSTRMSVDRVMGKFAFTQNRVDSNEHISKALNISPKYLCDTTRSSTSSKGQSVGDWTISVGGAVSNAYEATFDELKKLPSVQKLVMGCACAGNSVDGRASANAAISGIPLLAVLGIAQPAQDANTIVFTSADGYEIAVPFSYVKHRYCPIVFDVNGSPLSESVGGTNQLWLGSTAANYFARDIVSITVEVRDQVPLEPNSDEARAEYANLPNIGLYFGGEVE